MVVEPASIGSFRGYEDRRAGVRERFLTPRLAGGRTVAVVTEPLSDPQPVGWVLCHSFGLEQDNLQAFEAGVARRLAASGFTVLRYHSQGYGDSELPVGSVTIGSHVQGAVDAASLLMETPGVDGVGLIGAKFGGSVALLAADRSPIAAVALLDPIVRGRPYMQASLRSALIADLSGDEKVASSPREDPMQAMERDGYVDVHGFPLRPDVFEEICELDLTRAVESFAGRSLVLQVSRSPKPRKDVEQLVGRLLTLGGDCRLEVLARDDALRFGLPRFRAVSASTKADLLEDLGQAITATAVSWCAERVGQR